MLFLFFLLNITNSVLNDISFSYLVSLLLVCYAMQETQVLSLGGEDALEKEMATHSSILAWRIPWTEEPGGLHTVHGVTKNGTGLSK